MFLEFKAERYRTLNDQLKEAIAARKLKEMEEMLNALESEIDPHLIPSEDKEIHYKIKKFLENFARDNRIRYNRLGKHFDIGYRFSILI